MGGNLIVHGDGPDRALDLLNGIFAYSLVGGLPIGTGDAITGPTVVTGLSATNPVTTASLPAGANSTYTRGTDTAVFDATVGTGTVTFLAYDWFAAAPNGTQDAGWLTVLANAVVARGGPANAAPIPTLSEWAIILLIMLLGFVAIKQSKTHRI